MSLRSFFRSLSQMFDPKLMTRLGLVVWGVAIILLGWFLVSALGGKSGMNKPEPSPLVSSTPLVFDEQCPFRRSLDGVCVDTKEEVDPPLVGVMVEYSIDAWPVSGIDKARVVFEAPVEGAIPRFFAVYLRDDAVSKVGPVRSARPYYLDWLGELGGAMYMHVGGSPEALNQLSNDPTLFDVNEFFRGWFFWRSDDRGAPHNVYTASRLWQKAWEEYGENKKQTLPLRARFETQPRCTTSCAQSVTIPSQGGYEPVWTFTSSTGLYVRQDRYRGIVGTEVPVEAKTILVLEMPMQVIDAVGRRELSTIGEGKLTVIGEGTVRTGRWQKTSRTSSLQFVGDDGVALPMSSGIQWIHIVRPSTTLIIEEEES